MKLFGVESLSAFIIITQVRVVYDLNLFGWQAHNLRKDTNLITFLKLDRFSLSYLSFTKVIIKDRDKSLDDHLCE